MDSKENICGLQDATFASASMIVNSSRLDVFRRAEKNVFEVAIVHDISVSLLAP